MTPLRFLAYFWALPNTVLGLLFVPLAYASRGRARRVSGVLEVHGAAIAFLLDRCVPIRGGALALTLGHVVIGRTPDALEVTREHERVHVRQYERWGPLFLPAYFLCSFASWVRGGEAYRGNPFEREAYGHDRQRGRCT